MSVKDKSSARRDDIERPYEEIGLRIQKWRMSNNILQTVIADSGVTSLASLQRVESGRRSPSIELLVYLREKHNLDLNYILTGQEG